MSSVAETNPVQRLISDIDHLISEMLQVRRRVAELDGNNGQVKRLPSSVRDAEWFGMWADRENFRELSSHEWLTQQRAQHRVILLKLIA